MASAYSSPLNYQDTLNISDVAKYTGAIQEAMQQKFDINSAKIQDLVGQISNVNLKRDKDKQYLGERLQKMVQMVDASGKLNLTDNTVTSQINNYISGAIDENVKKQIGNSQAIDQFNSQVQKLVEKDPKLYNDVNYSYAKYKAGYNEYASGASDDLGGLNYTPYVDKGKVLEELEKIKKLKGDEVIERVDGQGRKTKTTLNGLRAEEIAEYMPELLSSDVLNQLKMDGWYKYKDNMSVAQEHFKNYKTQKTESVQEDIKEQEAIFNSKLHSQAQKDQAKKRLGYYKKEKESLDTELNSIDQNDPEQIGYFLERGSYQQSLARIASGRISVSEEVDAAFFAQRNLELAYEKNEREKEELALKREKQASETVGADGVSGGGGGGSGGFAASNREDANQEDNPDYLKKITEDHGNEYGKIVSNINQAYSGDAISDEQRTIFRRALARKGFYFENGKLTVIKGHEEETANQSRTSVAIQAFTEAKMNVSYPQQAKELAKSDLKSINLASIIAQVNKKTYLSEFNENADEYIGQLKTIQDFTNNIGIFDTAYGAVGNPGELLTATATGAVAVGAAAAALSGGMATPFGAFAGGVAGFTAGAWKGYGDHKAKLSKAAEKVNSFIEKNGGKIPQGLSSNDYQKAVAARFANIKKTLSTDQEKVKALASLMRETSDVSAALYSAGDNTKILGLDLNSRAKSKANAILIDMNKKGTGAYLTGLKEFNILNKTDRTNIISLISQSKDSDSALFSDNMPMTTWVDSSGNIKIKQLKGSGESEKRGIFAKNSAEVTVEKGTALYNYIESKLDMTTSNQGLNANVAGNAKIEPYVTPEFIDIQNQEVLQKSYGAFRGMSKKITNEFVDNPENYLSEEGTREAYHRHLKSTFQAEDIDRIVDLVQDNLSNFGLTVRPIDGSWGATIVNKGSGYTIENGKFTTVTPNLDDDMLDLTRNYPQVLIADRILSSIIRSPKSVNRIFDIK